MDGVPGTFSLTGGFSAVTCYGLNMAVSDYEQRVLPQTVAFCVPQDVGGRLAVFVSMVGKQGRPPLDKLVCGGTSGGPEIFGSWLKLHPVVGSTLCHLALSPSGSHPSPAPPCSPTIMYKNVSWCC